MALPRAFGHSGSGSVASHARNALTDGSDSGTTLSTEPFPHHKSGSSAKIEADTIQPGQLGYSERGAAQQLKDGAIP